MVVTALNHALHAALDPDPTQQQKGNEKKVEEEIRKITIDNTLTTEQKEFKPVEALLRHINNQEVGFSISGEEISKLGSEINKNISSVGTYLKSITKLESGLQIKLTFWGKSVTSIIPNVNLKNGTIFKVNNVSFNNRTFLKISSDNFKNYGQNYLFIKDNQFSKFGSHFSNLFP